MDRLPLVPLGREVYIEEFRMKVLPLIITSGIVFFTSCLFERCYQFPLNFQENNELSERVENFDRYLVSDETNTTNYFNGIKSQLNR